MAIGIVMLIGSIIVFVFFVLGLILTAAVLAQLFFFALIIAVFTTLGTVTGLIGASVYLILAALGLDYVDIWAAVSPYVYIVFGVVPIVLLLTTGAFFGVIQLIASSQIVTYAGIIVTALTTPVVLFILS